MKWRPIQDVPAILKGAQAFQCHKLTAIIARETVAPDDQRWHLSISHPKRYPTWNEIFSARYDLLPLSITVAMFLPPPSQYVNVHPNCFHLWETTDGDPLCLQV